MKSPIRKQIYHVFYLGIKLLIKHIMNLREKVNALFAKHNVSLSAEEVVAVKQMVEAVLEDGTSIFSDSDTFAEGVRVFTKNAEGEESPAGDGEYKTAEGIVVVIAGGLVTEIKPAVVEEEEKSNDKKEDEEKVMAEEQAVAESFNSEVEGLLSLVAKLESELAEVKKTNAELSSNVEKLSAQPAVQSIKEIKQSKTNVPAKPYAKMSAEERFVFHLNK